jgi:hypothetical protein
MADFEQARKIYIKALENLKGNALLWVCYAGFETRQDKFTTARGIL